MLWFALEHTLFKPLVWLVGIWKIRERLIGLRSSGSLGILHGTSNVCIKYGRTHEGLQDFAEADFGGDLDKRKSTSGYVFCLRGSTIS